MGGMKTLTKGRMGGMRAGAGREDWAERAAREGGLRHACARLLRHQVCAFFLSSLACLLVCLRVCLLASFVCLLLSLCLAFVVSLSFLTSVSPVRCLAFFSIFASVLAVLHPWLRSTLSSRFLLTPNPAPSRYDKLATLEFNRERKSMSVLIGCVRARFLLLTLMETT
eukprot:3926591-Rhodomonas_salina.1